MSQSREFEFRVPALSRVEGEGGLYLRIRNRQVEEVRLDIYEPPRLFEALLRGRKLEEVPDIVARICGICPVAYQMSSVHALEAALGLTITPQIRQLRRLLYCGEWIESHGLHVYLLNAPDFLGCDSGLHVAERHPAIVERGLRLKKHGNELLEALGGRAIHPINVAVGGFHRLPRREELSRLIPDFEWGLEAAVETTRWVAGLDFPEFERPCEFVSLAPENEYPLNEGVIGTSTGERIPVAEFENCFAERQVPHSTALQAVRTATGEPYFLGPLARVNLNYDRLCPRARQVAEELRLAWPMRNPFRSIIARGLELIHLYDEALSILRGYEPQGPAHVPYDQRAATGVAATEAPRGLLYHRYEIAADGKVTLARIVPPTSQNQAQIERDLRDFVPSVLDDAETLATRSCENLVRSYDPCISCSTHFLRIAWDRGRDSVS
ncbi:MAG: Ni/Fe hydrogenase subunit alpha [Pirellulales bacterium]